MAPFDMFNDVQDHVLMTAQTHIDRVVLEAFVAGVDRTEDPDAKKLLDTVCDLYALSTIEADKAWFLEHGQLTPARAKLLTSTVNQLLRELRPHMITLVDAFAIPHEWKAAQILEEEADRQEAMAARDAEVRAEAEGDQASGESATELEVAPAQ
jgi:acyl-CoA oxidase